MPIQLGLNTDLTELGPIYQRSTHFWNRDVTEFQVDPNNAALQAAAIAVVNQQTGATLNEFGGRMHPDFNNVNPAKPYGIPVIVVGKNTPRVFVDIADQEESDHVLYPIPYQATTDLNYIENQGRLDGDRHMIMIDKHSLRGYELSYAEWDGTGWSAGYGAVFDYIKGTPRPPLWTSTDAAGFSVLAGLLRYDEVYGVGEIEHALRFCLKQNNGFVKPASHDNGIAYAGAPPLGSRIRLKASFDTVNKVGGGTYSAPMQKILRCLKTYGGLMADRGGGFFFQGTMDPRWPWFGPEFHTLHLSDFEFLEMGYDPGVGIYRKKIIPSLD